MYVTDGMFSVNGTTSVPKSVLRYTVDKVRQVFETEVCYSNVSFVQNLKKREVFLLEVFRGGLNQTLSIYANLVIQVPCYLGQEV